MCSPVPINMTGLLVAATLEEKRDKNVKKGYQNLHLFTR